MGKVITDVEDKWYDGKYLNHTMNGLDCYPVYMQVGEVEKTLQYSTAQCSAVRYRQLSRK